jgi:hypothetical protein
MSHVRLARGRQAVRGPEIRQLGHPRAPLARDLVLLRALRRDGLQRRTAAVRQTKLRRGVRLGRHAVRRLGGGFDAAACGIVSQGQKIVVAGRLS